MELSFTKMHGAGNDFLVIDDMDGRCRLSAEAIAGMCSRRRGVGGDGLILIRPGENGRFAMRYYNSDGGEADMCGNGARCAAAFAFEAGIAGRTMSFETRSGIVGAEIMEEGVRVSIGDVRALKLDMKIAATELPVHYGVCGVPHAVIVVEDVRALSHDEFVRFAARVRERWGFRRGGGERQYRRDLRSPAMRVSNVRTRRRGRDRGVRYGSRRDRGGHRASRTRRSPDPLQDMGQRYPRRRSREDS